MHWVCFAVSVADTVVFTATATRSGKRWQQLARRSRLWSSRYQPMCALRDVWYWSSVVRSVRYLVYRGLCGADLACGAQPTRVLCCAQY